MPTVVCSTKESISQIINNNIEMDTCVSTLFTKYSTKELQNGGLCENIKEMLQSNNKIKRKKGVELIHSYLQLNKNNKSNILLFNLSLELLLLTGDKKSEEIRLLSEKVSLLLFKSLPIAIMPVFINNFIIGGKKPGLRPLARWQTKVTSLKILSIASELAPVEIERMMSTLVPIISKLMWDVKKHVKIQAAETLEDVCDAIGNIDLEPFIPRLIFEGLASVFFCTITVGLFASSVALCSASALFLASISALASLIRAVNALTI